MKKIEKNKKYRIKGKPAYFKKKYGTFNPIITIEDTDEKVFGDSWKWQKENPTCLLFAMRVGLEGRLSDRRVWYGKIKREGELVFEHEIEEIV